MHARHERTLAFPPVVVLDAERLRSHSVPGSVNSYDLKFACIYFCDLDGCFVGLTLENVLAPGNEAWQIDLRKILTPVDKKKALSKPGGSSE